MSLEEAVMTSTEIKKQLDKQPFEPFALHLLDGRRFQVPHPEFAWVHPSGRTIHIADSKEGGTDILDILLIGSISVRNGHARRRKSS